MKYSIFLIVILLAAGGLYLLSKSPEAPFPTQNKPQNDTVKQENISANSQVTILAENLDTPWALAFLPDKSILVTERQGTVRHITSDGKLEQNLVADIKSVDEVGEGGLLGVAVHPDFISNNFVYLYYTYNSIGDNTLNRVVRMIYKNGKLSDEKIIVNEIPGASNHNGGRIKFGPDKYLYIGTGDAQIPSQAQTTSTLGGKILRVTDEGKAAPENPFNNEVFSYGHRNVQGIAWSSDGRLWATEHGRSGVTSGLDELNLIQSGKNYGWPIIEGNTTKEDMETPVKNSGANETWAPGGMDFIGNKVYFGGLRGAALYESTITGSTASDIKANFKNDFGRIRDVVAGPDGMLYITTSNKDGRGTAGETDDKVIKINPQKL